MLTVAAIVAAVWLLAVGLGIGAARLRGDACPLCDSPPTPDGGRHAAGCPAR